MSTTIQPPQIHELVDNHAGIYIPRTFVRSISRDRIRRASHEDLDILEAGDGEAVVHHLVGAHAADCDAHCPACDRGYCRPHAAIEDS